MIRASFRSKRGLLCARATEMAAPLLRVFVQMHCGAATPKATWRRGLLIGANHIGDILYRTSSLAQLAKGLPGCTWDILAPEPAAQVLEGNPAIRKIQRMEIPMPGSRNFQRLKAERYDAAICYDSGSYTKPLLTTALLGIPNRVGYVHKGLSGLVTLPIRIDYPQPFPAYFRDLVSQVIEQPPDWDLRPKVYLSEQDHNKAEALWSELNLRDDRPVLACFVTTRQPTGVWPLERFRETLELLHHSSHAEIVLCGAIQDAEKLKSLQSSLSFQVSINAGRLGLRALIAFLAKCDVILSTDSGPRHLANASGTPVAYFRNLRSSKIETGNYLHSEYDFAPDESELINETQVGRNLDLISPAFVAQYLARCLVNLASPTEP